MKKRILSALLALAMLLTLVPTVAFAATPAGSGTEGNPYLISSVDDWKNLLNTTYPNYLNGKYIALTANIDLNGESWTARNLQNSTFDGQGYRISNAGQPLFSSLYESTIKNLAVVGASVVGTRSFQNVGILAEAVSGNSESKIENCYVSGSVTGNYLGVGGLIGKAEINTTISNCAADVTVTNIGTNSTSGAGGLVGAVNTDDLTISNCYVTGKTITTGSCAGGFVGATQNNTSHTITIIKSVALQSEVSSNSTYYEKRLAGSSVFETTRFNSNYAYAGMTGKYHPTGYTEGGLNGTNVSKENCTTKNFWETTMGFDTSVWTLEDSKLPRLKNLSSMTGDPPTYLLDAANCPVALGDDTTVAVSFLTTDANDAVKTDTIAITCEDGATPSVSDFVLSSSETNKAPISGLSVEKVEGNTVTVQVAKSVTAENVYLFYKSYCIGTIAINKKVNKVQLDAPANAKWDTNVPAVPAKATWSAVDNATEYSVQLYKGDETQGAAVTTTETFYDFTSAISESGDYTFKVKAIGDSTYADSGETTSTTTYKFTQQTLTNLKQSAEAALREMQVTNDTTATDVMKVVTARITNQSITADWSTEKPFNKQVASDGQNTGTAGKITGTIVLKLDGETETIDVVLTIQPKFSVTFAGGAADSGTPPTQVNVTAGTKITLPANTFTYYGKKFNGWSDGENTYQPGIAYTMPDGNVTFTAQWVDDVWDGETASDELSGSGTAEDPYIIASGADLKYLSDNTATSFDRYYKMMADINMNDHPLKSITNLYGTFDGNGHKITGLSITSNNNVYYGLFDNVGGTSQTAVIKNLTLENASLTYTNETGEGILGLLVRQASDSVSIENCYVTGTINAGTYGQMRVGGLVGKATGSNVKISQCYAGVTFTGGFNNSSFGGLVGNGENITIENCYATPDMTGVNAGYCSGISNGQVTIKNCYAAGTNFNGAGIARNNATVTNSVSIFPEMKGSARIGVNGTNNYGFAGTIQRNNNDEIITPSDATIQGADATAAQLKDMTFYTDLGWSADIWEIRSDSGYAFPVLKGQKTTPTLNLDLEPSVTNVTLDKTTATLPCGGTLQLTATVDVKNGADRTVVWNSSDTTKAVVDGSGKVTVQPNATSGTVKITATAAADGSKFAIGTFDVNTNSYTLTAERDPTVSNSPYATCKFYLSKEDALNQRNDTTLVQFGQTVYAYVTGMDSKDILAHVFFNGEEAKKESNSIYSFTMPDKNTTVKFSCAEWLNAYNYVWFVGMDWSTWGTTATYTTTGWSANNTIGSLKITNIINGKKFASFNLKSVSAYDINTKEGTVVKTMEAQNSQADLHKLGDYFVDTKTDPDHPVLYVYNDKPGTIIVDIEVVDDTSAEYSITQEEASKDYYTLDKTKAKANETVTATLTPAGIAAIGDKQSMTLDYYGGLLVVMFPGQFHDDGTGNWTASFTMPPQDITTRVYASSKQEVKLSGTDKTVEYNGQPQTIDSAIKAELEGTDVSEAMWGHYEMTYNGSTTAPTDAGTYECVVKIPASNPLYFSNTTVTVKLIINKSTPKVPRNPQAQERTYNSVTLAPPTTFADGTQIPSGYKLEYKCGDGAWQDSPTFTGLLPGTSYTFYARIKETDNTYASPTSQITITTEPVTAAEWTENNTQYKLVLSALSDPQMKSSVMKANSKITESNIDVYSVKLLSKTGESNWTEVQQANFPAGGITATLPYPAGSGATGYDFVVMQGPAESAQALSVSQKTAEGLQVKLTRLEAIAVGYCTASSGSHGNHGNGGTTTKFPFTDVAQGSYYYDAVAWAVDRGITSGTSATTFSPDAICTRAQAVTFLWRAVGSPQPTHAENPFTDVSPSAYYYQAILWAVEQGITNGTSATTFSPDLTVTRAHTVTFLWRLAGRPAADQALAFPDVEPGSYYETAVRWAIQKQITNGTSAAAFSPDLGCTRAQMVTFLYRDLAAQSAQ